MMRDGFEDEERLSSKFQNLLCDNLCDYLGSQYYLLYRDSDTILIARTSHFIDNGEATMATDLPAGRAAALDPSSGRTYFYCEATRETTWERPVSRNAVPAQPSWVHPPPFSSYPSATPRDLPVQAARYMLERQQPNDPSSDIELSSLSAGQIADLCYIQRRDAPSSTTAYMPIAPYELSETTERHATEAARIDTRLHTLYDQLRRIR